jgi:hypothetical protein
MKDIKTRNLTGGLDRLTLGIVKFTWLCGLCNTVIVSVAGIGAQRRHRTL